MKSAKYLVQQLLIICCLLGSVQAQNLKIDSLKQLIADDLEASELMNIHLELADQYYYINKDTSTSYSMHVLTWAKANNDLIFQAKALKAMGNAHFVSGKLDQAMSYYNEALDLAHLASSLEVESSILVSKASLQVHMDKPDEAITSNKRNLEILRIIGDSIRVAETMLDLVDIYQPAGDYQASDEYLNQAEQVLLAAGDEGRFHLMTLYRIKGKAAANRGGNYAKGAEYLLKALRISEEYEQLNHQMAILAGLGSIYRNSGDFNLAEVTYRKLVKLHEENGINVNLHRAYQRLARTLKSQGKTSESIRFYRKSMDMAIVKKRMINATSTSAQLALMYLLEGVEDSAAYFHEYAKENFRNRNLEMGFASFLNHMGEYSLRTGNYEDAEKYYLRALNVGEKVDYGALEMTAAGLHRLYSEKGHFQKAYQYALLKNEVSDSVNSRDQIREIARLQSKFESDKEIARKQNEIVLLQVEQQNAELKMNFLAISIGLIIIIAFLTTRILLARKERKKKQMEEVARFKEAMTGMIAHDLKNPLGIILGSEPISDINKAMASQMLNLVENMLDVQKFEHTEIQLKLDAYYLNDIIGHAVEQVQYLLMDKNVQLDIQYEEEIIVEVDYDYMVRILVNFLTNAIKFSDKNGSIEVLVERNEDKVQVRIVDHGIGIAPEKVQHIFDEFSQLDARNSGNIGSTGLGLSFCKLALKAHGSEINVTSGLNEGASFDFQLRTTSQQPNERPLDTLVPIPKVYGSDEKKAILDHLPELRKLKIHEAFEIEQVLVEIKDQNKEGTNDWAEAVLNAAYTNNLAYFQELLDSVETPQAV